MSAMFALDDFLKVNDSHICQMFGTAEKKLIALTNTSRASYRLWKNFSTFFTAKVTILVSHWVNIVVIAVRTADYVLVGKQQTHLSDELA